MNRFFAAGLLAVVLANLTFAQSSELRLRSDPPAINSSWDDLLEGINTVEEWYDRRNVLKLRYLDLIRDQFKPAKVDLDITVHEEVEIEGHYRRLYISYQVEADERAHAYLGIPLGLTGKAPAVVALHGTTAEGSKQTVGINGNPDKAFLDHLCRRGYVVIAPEHFVSGERIPAEGAYDTSMFYKKHPEGTAVGKFNFEHSIAVDVLLTREEVDADSIGVMGHSLGGHGAYFLAAYDDRLKACVCNCGAAFLRHNPQVEAWARDHWYIYLKPIRPLLLKGELPDIDMHEIIALIAPRAFMDVSAWNDGIPLTQRQRALMLLKIADVYELVGKPENFGFYIHGRGHSAPHESRELIYGFLDSHLKPTESIQTKLIKE
ncbi:dienelactone hydrolase family protein [Pirellulaceae bacterium SH449]